MAASPTTTVGAVKDQMPKDYFSRLPSEIQHAIFDYLFPTHEPRKAFEDDYGSNSKSKAAAHSLDFLAATSRYIRSEIMDWALHFLKHHSKITNYKPLKTPKLQATRNFLRGRSGLLTWVDKNCVFCGKKSVRSAVLMNGFRCCVPCDGQQWPGKITKTCAKLNYYLKDHHLLPREVLSPSAAKHVTTQPDAPKIRYGTCICQRVRTTIFLEKDVKSLAAFYHGNLEAYLEKRRVERDQRREKIALNLARKAAKLYARS